MSKWHLAGIVIVSTLAGAATLIVGMLLIVGWK